MAEVSQPQDLEEHTFKATAVADAETSPTYPAQCSSLRKNGYVILKSRPCKISHISACKPGKHGHAKINLTGIDIFSGRKYEDSCPSSHKMDVPIVVRKEYLLVNISSDRFLSLMPLGGVDGAMMMMLKEDLRLPGEGDMGDKIERLFWGLGTGRKDIIVAVVSAMGEELVVEAKEVSGDWGLQP